MKLAVRFRYFAVFALKLLALPAIGLAFMAYVWTFIRSLRSYAASGAGPDSVRTFVFARLDELERGPLLFATVILLLATFVTIWAVYKRRSNVDTLLEGVRELSKGNLDYQLPDADDDEQAEIVAAYEEAVQAAKKTKAELAEGGELSRAALEALEDGVITLGAKDLVTLVNPQAQKILGGPLVTKDDLATAARPFFDLETVLRMAGTEREVGLQQQPEFAVGDRTFEVVASPITDGKIRIKGYVLLFRDVTEQKLLQRVRHDFTAMLVHELRAPLINTRWTVEMLSEAETNNPETKSQLDTVLSSATGMLTIVNDILDVSKIEAGKFAVELRIGDLSALIDQKIAEFKVQATGKGITLTRAEPSVIPAFAFDRGRVGQVIANLLSNALKFTEKGSVSVRARVDDHGTAVRVSVEDTGPGIPGPQLRKLFRSFVQLVGSDGDKDKKGSGLGLAIVKGIVEGHGGRVGAESIPGKGSTFWFDLPIQGEKWPT